MHATKNIDISMHETLIIVAVLILKRIINVSNLISLVKENVVK